MAILRIVCPHCGIRLKGDTRLAGRTMPCPQCRQPFTIPSESESPSPVVPPPLNPTVGSSVVPPPRPTPTHSRGMSDVAIADLLGTRRPPVPGPSGSFTSNVPPRPSVPQGNSDELERIPLDDFPEAAAMEASKPLIVVSDDPGIHPLLLNPANRYLVVGVSHLAAIWERPETGWSIYTSTGWNPLVGNTSQLPRSGDYRFVTVETVTENDEIRITSLNTRRLPPTAPLVALLRSDGAILETTLGEIGLLREQKHAVYQYLRERFMPEVLARSQRIFDYLADHDLTTSEVRAED